MRRSRFMIASTFFLGAFVLAALVGCSGSATSTPSPNGSAAQTNAAAPLTDPVAIGKRIYLTGVDSDGRQMLSEAPTASQGALMLGGGGCAACHGANGRGGTVRAATTSITGPNITYGALIKSGFTDATIRAAILWCTDEVGKPLDETMPCWQMSATDADATVAYLKTLK